MQTLITPLNHGLVKQLREVSNRFGGDWTESKKRILEQAGACDINDIQPLVEYHDCLLFLLAYPENPELLKITEKELLRTSEVARNFFYGKNEKKKTQLINTGLAWTDIRVAFSFDMISWLIEKFREHIQLFSIDADKDEARNILSICLTKTEYEAWFNKEVSIEKWIQLVKRESEISELEWLIGLCKNANCSIEIRDHLFDSMKLYIRWSLDDKAPSRTFARSLPRRIFFHKKELQRKVNAAKLIRQPISKAIKLSSEEKKQLVETARGVLCMLLRETDPATYADGDEVELFDLGRGVDVALYPMIAERRLPIESYIGYQAFKNRMPLAYGGGWMFQHRCKIGINMFEPYRGGESVFLFCQVLRLYHHHFDVKRFVVEPYQIGKKNPEGLKSGAFWFYYRIGFRPLDTSVQTLADEEFRKIRSEKKYRSPLKVMKMLSVSNLELNLDEKDSSLYYDVSELSKAITNHINKNYKGERRIAEDECRKSALKSLPIKNLKEWTIDEEQSLTNFSILVDMISDLSNWSFKEKKELVRLIKAKGGSSEVKYISLLQKHRRLRKAFEKIIIHLLS